MTALDATGLKQGNKAYQFTQQEIALICNALSREADEYDVMAKRFGKYQKSDMVIAYNVSAMCSLGIKSTALSNYKNVN